MGKLAHHFILCSLAIYMIWQTLSTIFLHFDGAARIPNTLIVVSFLYILIENRESIPTSLKVAGGWWGYLFFSILLIGSNLIIFNSEYHLATQMISRFLFCCVFACQWKYSMKTTAFCTFFSMFVDTFFNVFYGETDLFSGQFERVYTAININEISLFACAGVYCIIYIYRRLSVFKKFFVDFFFVSFVVMLFLLASRTAVIVLFFLALYHFLFNIEKHSSLWRSRYFIVIVSCLFLSVFFLVLYNSFNYSVDWLADTSVVRRFMYQSEEVEKASLDDTFLNMLLGDRAVYLYKSWDLFLKNPLFGCGYCNYVVYYGIRCHNEWMAQLCEGGIAGFILLFSVFLYIIRNIMSIRSDTHKRNLLLAGISIIVIMGFGLFLTSLIPFWIILGLICAELDIEGKRDKKNMKEPDYIDQMYCPDERAKGYYEQKAVRPRHKQHY